MKLPNNIGVSLQVNSDSSVGDFAFRNLGQGSLPEDVVPEAPRFTEALQYFELNSENLPEGTNLTLTISYEDSLIEQLNLSQENLRITFFDDTDKRWVVIPSTVDTSANTVSAVIDHFSLWAVVDNSDAIREKTPATT